jgi:hypothetical protein
MDNAVSTDLFKNVIIFIMFIWLTFIDKYVHIKYTNMNLQLFRQSVQF